MATALSLLRDCGHAYGEPYSRGTYIFMVTYTAANIQNCKFVVLVSKRFVRSNQKTGGYI